MNRGISKDYHRLRSLIIQTRFPGFTAEVETAFWRVIDQENIYPSQPHFELAFKRHLKDDVELTDKATVHPGSNIDADSLASWASQIYEHYAVLDSAVDNGDADWFRSQIVVNSQHPRQNNAIKILEDRVLSLEGEVKALNSIDTDKSKRTGTLYKIILGLAVLKFRYNSSIKNSASSNIETALTGEYFVGAETIHKVLVEAQTYLDIQMAAESISS